MRLNMARTLITAPRRRLVPSTTIISNINTNNSGTIATLKLPYRSLSTTGSSSTVTDQEDAVVTTNTQIRPWKTRVVESHGDYRQEAWLEDFIGGPLYQHQKTLGRLPVPTIQDTLQRFLPTALPLYRTNQEATALQAAIDKFAAQAAPLQERLLARADNTDNAESSWLQHWWNTAGYLQVRDPLPVNVSYFFHFANDHTAESSANTANATNLNVQVKRGAAMLTAVADYRHSVATGQLPAEQVGRGAKKTPLCSVAYKYMLNACRIPGIDQDSYRMYDPAVHHHVVVARHGYFFAVPLVDPATGHCWPLHVLERHLEECRVRADQMQAASASAPGTQPPKLGWLTSSNRDDWARARHVLCQDPATEQALELLESGAVLLCLDDVEPVSRQECASLFCFGQGQGANRWFDKSIQLFCTNNGRAGLMGEHSMMDGMPVVGLANRITELTYDKCQQAEAGNGSGNVSGDGGVVNIFGTVQRNPQVDAMVEKAKQDFTDLIGGQSLHVQSFQGYGSDFMKQSGYSPDAYVQMAMQLATYRLFGEQAGTYEATQVRPFLHGRTETTRTVSTQSAAFVHEMGLSPKMNETDSESRKEKLRLLQDAVNAHVKYIGLAAKAQGVDRHLMGLSMLVKDGETAPDLYSDPLFARSKRWRVSTSNLTHPKFENWGYGEVFPDGVGLAYSVHKRHCIFNITALREHGWTDKLSQLLEEAMLEMRTLIEIDKPPMSKL